MSEGLEQVETLAVSNFEDEEKYLSEFDQLQRIIDMTQDVKIDLGYRERNDGKNWRKRKKKKQKSEKNVNVTFREKWKKEGGKKKINSKFNLKGKKLFREGKGLYRVKLKSAYVEPNSEDTVVCNFRNIVKLQKLKLKKFKDDVLKWQEFWDAFDSNMHQNKRWKGVDKFNYLRSQLVGSANETLPGLDMTIDNYNIAAKLLKKRYGRKQILIDAHYVQLINIPVGVNKALSLRTYFDVTEKHLRVLQSMGENIEQRQLLSIMKSKLQKTIMSQLEKKDKNEEWTAKIFGKSLERYITVQETGNQKSQMHHLRNENIFRINENSPSFLK